MSSAAFGDTSLPSSVPSSPGRRPGRPLRHVAFFFDGEEIDDSEKPHAHRAASRRGLQTTMTADEHRAWSTRAAESDALRQRALQCGEDIARVASGLGYEVVAHTPTAILKRNSTSTVAPAASAKPEVESRRFAAAGDAPARVVSSAAPLSPPAADAPQLPPVFLKEDALDSCSSRSSSPGTEEQVGLVPVLSPMLYASETAQSRPSCEAPQRFYEVTLPAALSVHESVARYSFTEPSTHPLQADEEDWGDNNDDRSSSFRLMRENLPATRRDNAANQLLPSSVNSPGERSAPSTAPSSPNASPLPRQSMTPRRAMLTRHQGSLGPLVASNQSAFQLRATMVDATSSRATSNASMSGGMEQLNRSDLASARASQNTNRLLTPATDVLNTPAVRMTDDEIWPRLQGRSIQ